MKLTTNCQSDVFVFYKDKDAYIRPLEKTPQLSENQIIAWNAVGKW